MLRTPSPLAGEGWGGGSTLVHNGATPTPIAARSAAIDPPRKGEGKTEYAARASAPDGYFAGFSFTIMARELPQFGTGSV
jgi:hypothetical protein